jgi:acetyl-CoA carboxylase biotin carboxylase subunit
VRVDTHGYEGYTVPPNYDSLVAKLIVSDDDRTSALARAAQALAEFEVEGISTTIPLFREMVSSEPLFRSGVYTTAYLEEAAGRLSSLSA